MSHRIVAKTFVMLSALLVLSAAAIRAEDNCQPFRAILPMVFDINTGWSGPLYAVIGTEVLSGKWSIVAPPQTSCDAVSCQDTSGRSRVDFGGSGLMNPGDTLTIELQTAQYPPGDGFATYRSMWKIVGGTGRFAQASGVWFENGPFVAWTDTGNIPRGQYIGEIDAHICVVKSPKNPSTASSRQPLTAVPAPALTFYMRQFSPSVRK